jgi:hypothetical protein
VDAPVFVDPSFCAMTGGSGRISLGMLPRTSLYAGSCGSAAASVGNLESTALAAAGGSDPNDFRPAPKSFTGT